MPYPIISLTEMCHNKLSYSYSILTEHNLTYFSLIIMRLYTSDCPFDRVHSQLYTPLSQFIT